MKHFWGQGSLGGGFLAKFFMFIPFRVLMSVDITTEVNVIRVAAI